MATERIQKVLAAVGFGARRACEALVLEGRVAVNGETVTELPCLVDPQQDRIEVDGKPVRPERRVYFLLNKPKNVVCTNSDPAGRTRAIDLMQGAGERLFPVGRLDADSTGLLLMTNDGALAQRLTHPRYGVPKTYRVEIRGCPGDGDLEQLRAGVRLSEGRTAPARIKMVHRQRDKAILEITLREGRNREIRRMLAKRGFKVRRLTRVQMGRLSIRKLPTGAFRPLTRAEVNGLHELADEAVAESSAARRPRSGARRRSGGGASPRKGKDRTVIKGAPKSSSASSKPAQTRKSGKPKRRIVMPDE